jgi:hypothetical protein
MVGESHTKEITKKLGSESSALIAWNLSGIGGYPEKYRLYVTNNKSFITDTIEFDRYAMPSYVCIDYKDNKTPLIPIVL